MKYLALAAFTLVVILLIQRFTRGFVKQIALLLGLVIGTLAAHALRHGELRRAALGARSPRCPPPSPSAPPSSSPPRSCPCAS